MTDAQDQEGMDKHLLEHSMRCPPTAEGYHLPEHTHWATHSTAVDLGYMDR